MDVVTPATFVDTVEMLEDDDRQKILAYECAEHMAMMVDIGRLLPPQRRLPDVPMTVTMVDTRRFPPPWRRVPDTPTKPGNGKV